MKSIGILPCCVLNDLFTEGNERLPICETALEPLWETWSGSNNDVQLQPKLLDRLQIGRAVL